MKLKEFTESLKLDSAEGILSSAKKVAEAPVNQGDPVHGEPEKVGIKIADAPSYEVHKDVAEHISKLHDCVGKVADAYDEVAEKHEKLKGEVEGMKGLMAKKDDKAKEDEKKMDSMRSTILKLEAKQKDKKALLNDVNARIELTNKAKALIGAEKFTELKLDEADDLEIKKAVIKVRNDKAVLDEKSADYIQGQFETLATQAGTDAGAGEELGRTVLDTAAGAKTFDQVKAEAIEKNKQAWKKPIGATREMAIDLINASSTK